MTYCSRLDKYKEVLTTVDHPKKPKQPKQGFEVVSSREKQGSRRPFDPVWDP